MSNLIKVIEDLTFLGQSPAEARVPSFTSRLETVSSCVSGNKDSGPDVIWKDADSNLENKNPEEPKLCQLCKEALSKYQCPKCLLNYCGLNCYKSQAHLKCSERFYQKEIDQHLKSTPKVEAEAKKLKMLKVLKKIQAQEKEPWEVLEDSEDEHEDKADSDSETELLAQFDGLDLEELSADEIWSKLGKAHQAQFQSLISGTQNSIQEPTLRHAKLTSIFPILQPWWDLNIEKRAPLPAYPSIPTTILPKVIHESASLSLINVVFAYCMTYRVMAGDIADAPPNLAPDMIRALAPGLFPPTDSQHFQFQGLEEQFFYFLQKKNNFPELISQPNSAFIIGWEDVLKIISPKERVFVSEISAATPPDLVSALLNHVYFIFKQSEPTLSSFQRKTNYFSQKKMEFLGQLYRSSNPLQDFRLRIKSLLLNYS